MVKRAKGTGLTRVALYKALSKDGSPAVLKVARAPEVKLAALAA